MFNIEMHSARSLECCFPHKKSCKETVFHVIETPDDNEGYYTGYSFCDNHWNMINDYLNSYRKNVK